MLSLSFGLLVATNIVSVAKVVLDILYYPLLNRTLFFSKKYRKIVAAILLLPSANAWFLVIRYNKLAALSSRSGYNYFPSKVW